MLFSWICIHYSDLSKNVTERKIFHSTDKMFLQIKCSIALRMNSVHKHKEKVRRNVRLSDITYELLPFL